MTSAEWIAFVGGPAWITLFGIVVFVWQRTRVKNAAEAIANRPREAASYIVESMYGELGDKVREIGPRRGDAPLFVITPEELKRAAAGTTNFGPHKNETR